MRLGVMCSGNGSNFENIHHACPKHDIVIMVYNKKKAKAKKRADRPVSYTHLTLPTKA